MAKISWNNPGSGDWSDAADWRSGTANPSFVGSHTTAHFALGTDGHGGMLITSKT